MLSLLVCASYSEHVKQSGGMLPKHLILPVKKGNDRWRFGTNRRVNDDVRSLVPPLGAGTHLPGRSLPILGEAHLAEKLALRRRGLSRFKGVEPASF